MSTVLLPSAKNVKELLSGLLGRAVVVAPGEPVTPAPNRPVCVAVYVGEDMAVHALGLLDLGAAAYTAGALALLPARGCQGAVEDGVLSDLHLEALHEVVNVLSAVLNTPRAPHSRLHKLYGPDDELPGDLVGLLAGFNRTDLELEIPGYGPGALSIVIP